MRRGLLWLGAAGLLAASGCGTTHLAPDTGEAFKAVFAKQSKHREKDDAEGGMEAELGQVAATNLLRPARGAGAGLTGGGGGGMQGFLPTPTLPQPGAPATSAPPSTATTPDLGLPIMR
ncbi:MAG: hypothetical protein IT371_03665 [Deltaproteobacteria bacterium]|nr:hypothetical protein [Deltaproteobacteria bacterium]